MDYIDTGVSKQAIGIPTDEEREQLIRDGYTLMSRGEALTNPMKSMKYG